MPTAPKKPLPLDPAALTTEAARQAAFAMLVRLQDAGVSISLSRGRVAEAFRTTYSRVCEVEREGIDKDWPPL